MANTSLYNLKADFLNATTTTTTTVSSTPVSVHFHPCVLSSICIPRQHCVVGIAPRVRGPRPCEALRTARLLGRSVRWCPGWVERGAGRWQLAVSLEVVSLRLETLQLPICMQSTAAEYGGRVRRQR